MTINLYDIVATIFIIFIIPSSLQNIFIFDPIPRLLGIGLVLSLILLLMKKINNKRFYILFVTFLLGISSCIYSNNLSLNIKDYIYFVTCILIMLLVSNKTFITNIESIFIIKLKFIKLTIYLMNIILLISLFIPSSYYSGWQESGKYFQGFTPMPHVIGGICFCLMTMCIFYGQKTFNQKKMLILMLLPLICIFMTGARTYLIPTIVLFLYFLWKILGTKLTLLSGILSSPFLFFIIINTSMYKKFLFAINFEYGNESLFSRLTSGRSDMWIAVGDYFIHEYNLINKLIGTSFDTVYEIIRCSTGMNVWAHNDIINTLATSGIVGVIIYMCVLKELFKIKKYRSFEKGFGYVVIIIYSLFILTNGFFITVPLIISLVFIIIAYSQCKEE